MARLNATDERCEALFASALQRSDELTAEAVSEAIIQTAQELGRIGCAGRMAQEFGDHPEAASERMRWALDSSSATCPAVLRPRRAPPAPSDPPPDPERIRPKPFLPEAA